MYSVPGTGIAAANAVEAVRRSVNECMFDVVLMMDDRSR